MTPADRVIETPPLRTFVEEAAAWGRSFESQHLVPTPVVDEFGHARTLDETERWVGPRLRALPVTRVYDATPLDALDVPVWAAVTPLALDLTVHAGKGLTPQASRLSAVMEAVERVSSESVPAARQTYGSYRELQVALPDVLTLDPHIFDLPFETVYEPDRPIWWVAGYDLIQERVVAVARDLVISPPREGVCRGAETNGLASGNTFVEAVLHAVYELIERDASAHEEFAALVAEPTDACVPSVQMVDLVTLPPEPMAVVERVSNRGMELRIQLLPSETGVAVFGALVADRSFPGREGALMTFAGYGCDLDPARAAVRAITEAAQSHTVVTLGARDTFEGTRPAPDRPGRLQRVLDVLEPMSLVPFTTDGNRSSGDLLVDLRRLLEALSAAGYQRCVVVNLARPDLDVPVVRVLIPGMAAPYAFSSRRPSLRLLTSVV